jgi:hypothetical protein
MTHLGGAGKRVPKPVVIWDSGRNDQTQPHRADDVTRESGNECAIRCHYSSAGATYSYVDIRRNIIASAEQFASRVLHHPFKCESYRMGGP